MVHVALLKQLINQFKPVQHSRKQVPRANCSNEYTVSLMTKLQQLHSAEEN